jgi:hypothetical protein
MKWHTEKPMRNGSYIVVDRVWRMWDRGEWESNYGWCIRGRWLGHDCVVAWTDPPTLPDIKSDE